VILACNRIVAIPSAGFFLPDSIFEFSMHYRTINNLIILPVTLNDSVKVNLILDTGCRNMLLFGKRFEKLFRTETRPVEFSGLGSGKPVTGKLSLNNDVSIQLVKGRRIPLIIVPERNLFSSIPNVHGVIGYEIFAKFEIEFNFPRKLITFRSASFATHHPDFTYISMNVVDAKPVLECSITTGDGERIIKDLLIDTGSSFGLMLASEEPIRRAGAVGRGLNGRVMGEQTVFEKIKIDQLELHNISASIVHAKKQNASIGMEILKDHVMIINYARSYVAFRNNS
jgi:hypothetical protein